MSRVGYALDPGNDYVPVFITYDVITSRSCNIISIISYRIVKCVYEQMIYLILLPFPPSSVILFSYP